MTLVFLELPMEACKLNIMGIYWIELKRGQYVGYCLALHLEELKKPSSGIDFVKKLMLTRRWELGKWRNHFLHDKVVFVM